MPRPTKLTAKVQTHIVNALAAGNYFDTACRSAGIGPSTGHQWKAWGEGRQYGDRKPPKDNAAYVAFAEAVARAEANAEVQAVALLRKAMPDDWRAAAEYLRRKHVDRWGRERVDVHTVTKAYGETMAEAFKAVLSDPRLKLSREQRDAVPAIITDVMRRYTNPDTGG